MAYSYLTWAQMRQQLAARLDDPANIYWTDAENKLYLTEALRTWQSYTRYWRDNFSFSAAPLTSPLNPFYDLTVQPNTLIPFTVKDTDAESLLCYNLIENQPSAGVWNGTDQFSIDDLTQALQRRRDQFLVETGMVLTRTLLSGLVPPVGQILLPDSVIDVRRASWIDAITGNVSILWKSDEFRAQALNPGAWLTSPAPIPQSYSTAVTPPVTMQLLPPAGNPGRVEMITVNAGAALNPATGVLLDIPDDFTWVIRFGALADLLGRDGQARDASRAAYCESRWQEGILVARAYTSVEMAFVNGNPVQVSSVFDLDTFDPNWQNTIGDPPADLLMCGWNLVGISPIPPVGSSLYGLGLYGLGAYGESGPIDTISVDLVRNAPIPASDSAFVQLGREELDAVLDYAQHLAAFKQGGSEFQATMKQYSNFRRLALVRNQRLAASLRSAAQPLFDKTWRFERQKSRRQLEVPVGISLDDDNQGE